jgi:branched-chain amino acid transport system permease protein
MSDISAPLPRPRSLVYETIRFYGMWIAIAVVLVALPRIFWSGGALTTFSLIGISIIFAMSYNILLGQTGMLSFGHAVYYGLGGFLAIHGMNLLAASKASVPLPLVPLVGGLAGLTFALLLGWVSTRRSGTVFAMISLGVAELVSSSALILRSFFGGEAGITTNRTKLFHIFGWSFGPQIQIYYMVAAWTLLAVIAMYALTRTPWGRMCNAVRDNPERVQFVGYDPHVIRYMAFCFAGFFAGIAGGLSAINFEIANSAYLGAAQSGTALFAAYIGGIGLFIGPIVGAIFVTYLSLVLSDLTSVWQLYFGLIFICVVVFAPGGIAGLLMKHRPVVRGRHAAVGAQGLSRGAGSPTVWLLSIGLVVAGYALARRTWAYVAHAWDHAATIAREKGYLA